MYEILQQAHSGWRYLVILAMSLAGLRYLYGMAAGRPWLVWEKRLMTLTLIAVDVQVLTGLVMLVGWQQWKTVGRAEHLGTMLIVVAIVHVTKVLTARGADTVRMRRAVIGLLVAGMLMGAGIYRITHLG